MQGKITIRVTSETKELLQEMADRDDRSLSDFVRIKLKEIVTFSKREIEIKKLSKNI